MTNEQIAEAFSRHAFATTYPHLAEDIVWDNVGGPQLSGRADVMEACDQSATYMANVTTRFTRFRMVVGTDSVVVDSVADYTDAEDETTTVASCDIYDFLDGRITRITSYTMELS